MEKLDLSKLKMASSSLGERIKTSGAQMGRTISSKMKEILQAPTPESKIVDEATADSMSEPNWGLNLRICAIISRGEYDSTEIVRAIKKKLVPGKFTFTQDLSLELLETCASNCDKVFSAVASEKVLEDMMKLIDDPKTEHGIRVRAMQLIKAWGESEDLDYLPVFRQTFIQLKSLEFPPSAPEEGFTSTENNMKSYLGQQQLSPPGTYPIPNTVATNEEDITFVSYSLQSTEEKKELLLVARNSLDILSSILNSDTELKPIQDDLTVTMLEKCKQSLPVVQRIIESTSDDEIMLFDALNLHDELQLAISRHDELVAASASASAQSKGQTTQKVSAESKTDEATWQNETTDDSITGSHESHNSSHQEDGADKKQQS